MQPSRIIPSPSPITKLGHVRIVRTNILSAKTRAAGMGLLVDQVYGTENPRLVDIACRHMGPRGNHEPRWTDAERDEFARAGL